MDHVSLVVGGRRFCVLVGKRTFAKVEVCLCVCVCVWNDEDGHLKTVLKMCGGVLSLM